MTTRPHVTIVGLGPADPQYVTQQTLDAIAAHPHRFIRTTRHPSAGLVGQATSFDDVYESADTFSDVYAEITERLVSAATGHGKILYAVPGSPLVLERTVRHLCADDRVDCTVLPAMSFLDIAFARLGIDPVEAGVRLIDGHEFATAAAGDRGPLFVAHTHANWVLSDIKLAVEGATGDEPVVILQRLGTPDEQIVNTTWAELDRTVEADHLTCIYIPHLGAPVGESLVRFHQLARTLREQCPWDQEQTHESLIKYLLEETYEVVDAIAGPRSGRPVDRHRVDRGTGRSALPDRVPRDDRRTTGSLHHGRSRRRDPRQAGATAPARVRFGHRRRCRHRGGQLGCHQARREGPHECLRRRCDVTAVVELRVPRAAQGREGRLRLARRRRRAAQDRRGSRRTARGDRQR